LQFYKEVEQTQMQKRSFTVIPSNACTLVYFSN